MKLRNIFLTFTLVLAASLRLGAQGWPANYGGVMLQGFYWDSYTDTQWSYLEGQADELSQYFSLVWIPQSGYCGSGNNMGYTPQYYFRHDSSFGSEAQLRQMIKTFKQKGIGTIADVVINHRNNLGAGGSWVDYPAETYQGVTYQMLPTDICTDDDGGKTKAWANGQGISISSNNDTGEDWSGCRDLDHKSQNVNANIKAYLRFLLEDLGYTGFRYDMVKGYRASFTADYNNTVKPQFSVGEYWDGTSAIRSWISGTEVNGVPQSGAFDFQFRYRVRDAINNGNWSNLGSTDMVLKDDAFKQYAVTFVENHDTERRSGAEQDPIKADTLQANAFLMAMPGTPCVFLKHWQDCKYEIKQMIEARQLAGITNTSEYKQLNASQNYYNLMTTGTNGRLICVVGKKTTVKANYPTWNQMGGEVAADYTEIITGQGYRYLLSNSCNTPWISVPSGKYAEALDVTILAVSDHSDATLVYTTDGSTPTATNKTITSGSTLHIGESCTLTVGLLSAGKVIKTVSHSYVVTPFEPHKATVYLRDPGFSPVYFYAWDGKGNLMGSWPGTAITDMKQIDGQTWYYHSFDIAEAGYTFNIIFNKGNGKAQTVDIGNIDGDRYFTVTEKNGSLAYTDVTATVTPVENIELTEKASRDEAVYDLMGRRVTRMMPGHIYIRDGKKILK